MKALLLVTILFVAAGLLLPHKYQLKQQITFSTTDERQLFALLDLKQWSKLMMWQRISQTQYIHFSTPSTGVGAHAAIDHQLGRIELTITKKTKQGIEFSMLFNNEHSAIGLLTFTHHNDSITVNWQISGAVHSTLLGGYTALYIEYHLRQMIISAYNNLQSELKLRAAL
ncbi:hypothetical protein PSECIP111854_01717 [Pseudoalteromonas sp. CIP111854]|uniref:Polyketide cyclase n=1 Tax=Pseudoalteromonas holothuriae TaxID=2963714 RepID=A0A9W4QW97_9GAMM|nr:hypothetical protein PSECIP111854_01717 [Pseudoalteromonas sp. CIP111854]